MRKSLTSTLRVMRVTRSSVSPSSSNPQEGDCAPDVAGRGKWLGVPGSTEGPMLRRLRSGCPGCPDCTGHPVSSVVSATASWTELNVFVGYRKYIRAAFV